MSRAKELWREPGFHVIAGLLGLGFAVLLFVPAAILFSTAAAHPIVQRLMNLVAHDDQWILVGLFAMVWATGILLTYLIATMMLGRRRAEQG